MSISRWPIGYMCCYSQLHRCVTYYMQNIFRLLGPLDLQSTHENEARACLGSLSVYMLSLSSRTDHQAWLAKQHEPLSLQQWAHGNRFRHISSVNEPEIVNGSKGDSSTSMTFDKPAHEMPKYKSIQIPDDGRRENPKQRIWIDFMQKTPGVVSSFFRANNDRRHQFFPQNPHRMCWRSSPSMMWWTAFRTCRRRWTSCNAPTDDLQAEWMMGFDGLTDRSAGPVEQCSKSLMRLC